MSNEGILIFGATGSTGTELAHTLQRRGQQIFLCGRSQEKLDALSQSLDAPSGVLKSWSQPDVDALLEAVQEHFERIAGVANLCGSLMLKPAHTTSDEDWQNTIEANLTSSFSILRSVAPVMQKTNGGSLVFVSSAAALTGMANHEAIAAAKAGIIGLTRAAAATYASRGLRVNCVAPGLVRSKMTESMLSNSMAEEISTAMHAVGRLGTPADISSMIAWLLSPENDWVTGQVFPLDGGLSAVMPKIKTKVS